MIFITISSDDYQVHLLAGEFETHAGPMWNLGQPGGYQVNWRKFGKCGWPQKLWNYAIPDRNMEHGRHGNDGESFHLLGGDGDVIMVNSEEGRCSNKDRAYLKSSNCQVIDAVHSNLN